MSGGVPGGADGGRDPLRPPPGTHFIAERLLVAVREEIGRADTKASILLSGAVAVLVVTLSWRRAGMSPGPGAAAALGVLLWAAGVVMLAVAVMPRREARRSETAGRDRTFFADLTRGGSGRATVEELLPRVVLAGREPHRWMVEQACNLGAILAAKYRWLHRGVVALAAGGLLLLVARLAG